MTAESALDIEQPNQLIAYLQNTGRIASDEQPIVRTLEGGVSNRTVFVERANGETWVLKQALEKLRVPVDWFSSPERIHREAMGIRYLGQLAPAETIPNFVFEDHDQHVLAMTAVPQPHANWKAMLLNGQLERDHVEQFGRLLGTIHRNAYERRESVADAFDDRSFFESLRIEPYYSYTAQQVSKAADFLHKIIEDTRATRLTLVHGDYSPKNILVYQDRLILLDHEVIHFGDPAFDIGFSMTHLLSKAHHLTQLRDAFASAALVYWNTYRSEVHALEWAAELEPRAVRHTLACLLARVAGRSKLEYLDETERDHQREIVLNLMAVPPTNMADLVKRFSAELG
jgi:5-methylthioribose kinase